MSSAVCKLEKDLCRCCHSEGSFKSLYAPLFWLDIEDAVYYNLLRECFNIELASVPEASNHMLCKICDACILRLRDAVEFKQQVEKCERRFQTVYLGLATNVTSFKIDIKEELPDPEDYSFPNITTSSYDGAIKSDLCTTRMDDGRTMDDDGASDRGDTDSELKDDDIPKQTTKRMKQKKSKVASTKMKIKKKIGRPKKTSTKNEEVDTIKGLAKVVKRPRVQLQENVDFKRVADEFHCSRCDKTLKTPYLLKHHVKTVHLKIPKYVCSICSVQFKTLAPFVKHKLEQHNIDERHICNACDTMFNTRVQLKRHKNSFHMLGEKSKCDECDYETFSVEALYKHKFKHKKVKDYHCAFCRKSFVRKTTLQLHERIHTGDRRKVCKVCGQAFVQKASLNYHMTKYHPEVDF